MFFSEILTSLILTCGISVIDLQPYRISTTIVPPSGVFCARPIILTNLNPSINIWYTISCQHANSNKNFIFHIENPHPRRQTIIFDANYPLGLFIVEGTKRRFFPLFTSTPKGNELIDASLQQKSYVPLCGGKLYLRNPVPGRKTALEWTTDFLRMHVPGGEKIIDFAKVEFLKDKFYSATRLYTPQQNDESVASPSYNGPAFAHINPKNSGDFLYPPNLGIGITNSQKQGMVLGEWYCAKNTNGIFVSVMQPGLVSTIAGDHQKLALLPLDSVESKAISYLIAFDLSLYDLSFVMGTEHPGVEWSPAVNIALKDQAKPGPDGIANVLPLVMTGLVPPYKTKLTVATFTGGFRRYHGAFRHGPLSLVNSGSHYGFIENGVVLSTLQPGLATVIMNTNGTVTMKTWQKTNAPFLPYIKSARQNGVALVEYDSAMDISFAGNLVTSWGNGNWSGSQQQKQRTVRAGIALCKNNGRQFLLYGYFSTATPSAMAKVFLSYQCSYAMLTDMNALEHTYLALYQQGEKPLTVQHLIKGMEVLDVLNKDSVVIPRFIGYPDNRDFFYLSKKNAL